MSTLHDQLEAAIKERLAVARGAGADGPAWTIRAVPPYTDPLLLASDGDMYTTLGTVDLEEHVRAFIAANGPDRIIRDCQRDLKVLERHRVCRGDRDSTHLDEPRCHACELRQPCPEIANLAEAYGITEASDG